MAFFVRIEDVERLGPRELNEYRIKIEDAVKLLRNCIEAFALSDSIEGETGESMKRYMVEVHGPLLDALVGALNQLLTDYSSEYLLKYEVGVTSGDIYGEYPEIQLKKTIDDLDAVRKTSIINAENHLRKASHHIPDSCAISIPKAKSLIETIQDENKRTKNLKDRVASVEGEGFRAFSADSSTYQKLMLSLQAALSACTDGKVSMGNYKAGAFSEVTDYTGLRENYLASIADQYGKADITSWCVNTSLNNMDTRAKDAEKDAAKKKAFWAGVGTVIQVGVVIAGAVAFVATAGTATPLLLVVGGLGIFSSGLNMFARADQLVDMGLGDWRSDVDNGELKGKDELETGMKLGDSLHEIYKYRGRGYDPVLQGQDVGFEIGDYAISGIKRAIKSNVDSAEGDLAVDAAGDVVNTGYDLAVKRITQGYYKPGEIKNGVIACVAGVAQAGTDYMVEKHDEELENLHNERNEISNLMKRSSSSKKYNVSINW